MLHFPSFAMKFFPLCAGVALSWTHHALAKSCLDLSRYQALNGTTIDKAELSLSADKIAHCRVTGSVAYGDRHNSVRFELWLPEQKSYNNRFMVVGKLYMTFIWLFSANINHLMVRQWRVCRNHWYGQYEQAIKTRVCCGRVYQAFSTFISSYYNADSLIRGDSGHLEASNGNGTTTSGQYIPFLNDAKQTKAWIHDSIAIITEPTRDITSEFYESSPKHSYYNGCSTGGAQGFALAQYYPHLFDGIYAGSPGNWYSRLMLSFLWNREHTKVGIKVS